LRNLRWVTTKTRRIPSKGRHEMKPVSTTG
jgi:hypothetical protein